MGKRKITEQDVKAAPQMATEARTRALFSLRRARQLQDGASYLKREYNANKKKKK